MQDSSLPFNPPRPRASSSATPTRVYSPGDVLWLLGNPTLRRAPGSRALRSDTRTRRHRTAVFLARMLLGKQVHLLFVRAGPARADGRARQPPFDRAVDTVQTLGCMIQSGGGYERVRLTADKCPPKRCLDPNRHMYLNDSLRNRRYQLDFGLAVCSPQ